MSKVKYDLGLDDKDPHADRVKIALVDAPNDTPHSARNPLSVAAACEERARQSKFANSNTGQMMHFDAALPNNLSADRLAMLASDINKTISEQFKVPAFSGVHLDYGNFHIHSSIPLYTVRDDGKDGFYLGDRIDHAKRPDQREALGLPRQPAGELRELRQKIADLIGDAVAEELADHPDQEQARHISERWRHGHKTLSKQVEEAAKRGDLQFVLDNLNRDATRKEWPRPQSAGFTKSEKREQAEAYNLEAGKPSATPAPELITRTLANRMIDLAQKAQITTPEGFRMLARDHGLSVHWAPSKEGKGVQGVTFSAAGGPRVAGRRIGASLGTLQRELVWAERPEYRRFAPRKGPDWDDYQEKVKAAGIKPVDSGDKAIAVTLDRLANLEAQAVAQSNEKPQAAPAASLAESGPTGPQEVQSLRQRPKRQSNDPSFNKRATIPAPGGRPASGRAAPVSTSHKVKTMTIDAKALMASLSALPIDETTTAVVGAVGSAAAVRETMPSAIRPHTLSEQQKRLLLQAFDEREAARSGSFDGPLSLTKERLDHLKRQISQHGREEPEGGIYLKKRLFRTPIMAETDEHKEWREAQEKRRQHAEKLEGQISKMQKSALSDPDLLRALSGLEQVQADKLEQQRLEKLKSATSEYEKAIEQLNDAPFGFQRNQLFRTIKSATDAHPELAERERLRVLAVQRDATQQGDYEHDDDAVERRRRNRSRER
ncbi:hypothetical protein [Alcaligenes aquatilis]|uniref:hypothetical protein n=1 Tax=Alcaligenes aquatilis TaxID=323284 RepID=UPI0013CECFE0|nr:hypothetical protein [Alcaligenes aquatilis]